MLSVRFILAALFGCLVLLTAAHAADGPNVAFTPADPRPPAVPFRIDRPDIAVVHVDGPALTIRLKPAAAKRLEALTAANVGRMMTLYYRDLRVQRAQIHAPVRNGLIYVGNPPDGVRHQLEALVGGS